MARAQGIDDFPVIMFYDNDKVFRYDDEIQQHQILWWVNKRLTPSELGTITEVNAIELSWYVKDNEIVMVYFFDTRSDPEIKVYEEVADSLADDYIWLATTDHIAAWSYGVEKFPALVMYRKYDEHNAFFKGEWTVERINKFITVNLLPCLVEFNEDFIDEVFKQQWPVMVMFIDTSLPTKDWFINLFHKAANLYHEDIMFMWSDIKEGI